MQRALAWNYIYDISEKHSVHCVTLKVNEMGSYPGIDCKNYIAFSKYDRTLKREIVATFHPADFKVPASVYHQPYNGRDWGKIIFDVNSGPLPVEVHMWLGMSALLEKIYMAETILNSEIKIASVSRVYTNFLDARGDFKIHSLPSSITGYPDSYTTPFRRHTGAYAWHKLRHAWKECSTHVDLQEIARYTAALFGYKKLRPEDHGEIIELDYTRKCADIVAGYWYRRYLLESAPQIKRYLPDDVAGVILEYLQDEAAHHGADKAKMSHGDGLLIPYVLYIFRDRLVRDALPADVTNSMPLEHLRTHGSDGLEKNQRYHIPHSVLVTSMERRGGRGGWESSRVRPGLYTNWSERMEALRSAVPPTEHVRPLQPHLLGMFVESEAFRESMVRSLFLAYEFAYCSLDRLVWDPKRVYKWGEFVDYYDKYWEVEIMTREHEYFNRCHEQSSLSSRPDSRRVGPAKDESVDMLDEHVQWGGGNAHDEFMMHEQESPGLIFNGISPPPPPPSPSSGPHLPRAVGDAMDRHPSRDKKVRSE